MTSASLAAPLLAASGLLVAGGAAKAARPHDTARALRAAGLPVPASAVRLLAGIEVVVGAAAAVVGGPAPAAAVAASYAAFTAFLTVALRRGWSLSSCGCFGEPDSPPTVVHLVVDAALALAAGCAAASGGPAPLAHWEAARGLSDARLHELAQ